MLESSSVSFIPKKRKQWFLYGERGRSHAIVVNQFTGQEHHFLDASIGEEREIADSLTRFFSDHPLRCQEHHFLDASIGEEREIADSLTRFFSDHPLRSGGMMHPEAVGLLDELGYILRKENN